MSGPILRLILADWQDLQCPCGARRSGRDGANDAGHPGSEVWIQDHTKHSDGTMRIIHDAASWRRFCAGPVPEDRIVPLDIEVPPEVAERIEASTRRGPTSISGEPMPEWRAIWNALSPTLRSILADRLRTAIGAVHFNLSGVNERHEAQTFANALLEHLDL